MVRFLPELLSFAGALLDAPGHVQEGGRDLPIGNTTAACQTIPKSGSKCSCQARPRLPILDKRIDDSSDRYANQSAKIR